MGEIMKFMASWTTPKTDDLRPDHWHSRFSSGKTIWLDYYVSKEIKPYAQVLRLTEAAFEEWKMKRL